MSADEERADEKRVERLREVLGTGEPLPMGMRSRLEARLSAESRRMGAPSLGAATALGLSAFVGGGTLWVRTSLSAEVLAALVAAAVLYAAGLRTLLGDRTRKTG